MSKHLSLRLLCSLLCGLLGVGLLPACAPSRDLLHTAPPPSPIARPPLPEGALPPEGAMRLAAPAEGAPRRGPSDALVTLVIFSDFECRFCGRLLPTLERVLETYPDEVALVFRHLPLPSHEHAAGAALASVEARAQGGDQAFWAMHDRLFAQQDELDLEGLERAAAALGLDPLRFRQALLGGAHIAAVQADMQIAMRLGIRGTPTFFVNGRPQVGAVSFEDLRPILEQELRLGRREVRQGLAASGAYARRMAEASEAPPPEPAFEPGALGAGEGSRRIEVPIPADAPSRGPAEAPIVLQVFSDFECGFCARARGTLERLAQTFPEEVRIVFRHLPLRRHPHARAAAEAAIEVHAQAGDAAFWAFHDRLFAHQDALETADLLRYAGSIEGVDRSALERALSEGRHRARVERDAAAARGAGIDGTPAFVVGSVLVSGAPAFVVLERIVDGILDGEIEGSATSPP
ncbi:MAG: thioredoxin domain-containing protein [Myxococcales bacterium]|nr:thioredoxin domain-containing protein [Myxococcales bacterium]